MLTADDNKLLTQVGQGTPMGSLLRHYWMPIAAVSEFDSITVKPVRLMAEDLVLFRDLSGNFGLVDRHCPHRRADLSYGFVEECGIRCSYHGWAFSADGKCLEQPFDDIAHPEASFRDRVKITSYPVAPMGGLLWAYLGPQPAPELPNWEPFSWPNGFVQLVFSHVPCNWLQAQENSIDPVHFEWMHANWTSVLKGNRGPYQLRHVAVDFEEFEFGFLYKRRLENTALDDPRWETGRVVLWPNALGPFRHIEWRVPIDDENMLFVNWHFSRVPKESEPYVQKRIPSWEGPIRDPLTGRFITSHVQNQDIVAWVGQGAIADRTQEHLGSSDVGVIRMRKRFLDDIQRIQRGEDPKGLIRDAPRNDKPISLPHIDREDILAGKTLAELLETPALDPRAGYPFQYGQPQSVFREYLVAMGMDPDVPLQDRGTEALTSAGFWTAPPK